MAFNLGREYSIREVQQESCGWVASSTPAASIELAGLVSSSGSRPRDGLGPSLGLGGCAPPADPAPKTAFLLFCGLRAFFLRLSTGRLGLVTTLLVSSGRRDWTRGHPWPRPCGRLLGGPKRSRRFVHWQLLLHCLHFHHPWRSTRRGICTRRLHQHHKKKPRGLRGFVVLVEAAGFEPASASTQSAALHV